VTHFVFARAIDPLGGLPEIDAKRLSGDIRNPFVFSGAFRDVITSQEGRRPSTLVALRKSPSPSRKSADAVQHFSPRPPQRNLQRRRAVGVRRATQHGHTRALPPTPDSACLPSSRCVDEVARHLAHAVIDARLLWPVATISWPHDGAALIDLVVVDQDAARLRSCLRLPAVHASVERTCVSRIDGSPASARSSPAVQQFDQRA